MVGIERKTIPCSDCFTGPQHNPMTEIKYTVGKSKQSLFKPCWHHGWWAPTIGDLSVADVLQVGHRVVVANFGAGLELLQPLRRLPRRQFGARLGRDAA